MKFKKLVAPVVFGALSLAVANANAAYTTAGVEIKNTATLTYAVNDVTQDAVNAEDSFRVDVKLSFVVDGNSAIQSTDTVHTIDTGKYYLLGVYNVSNTGNTKTRFSLSTANMDGGEAVTGKTDTTNYTTTSPLRYFKGSDFTGEITAGAPLVIDKAATNSAGTVQEVRVYASTADIKGSDKAIIGATLTAAATHVTPLKADNSGDDTELDITAINSDANTAGVDIVKIDETDTGNNGIELKFPDFGTDPTDPTNKGLVKSSSVVWDPINTTGSGSVQPKAIPGAVVKYTVTLKNIGSISAENVLLLDAVPENTTLCTTAAAGNGSQCAAPSFTTDNLTGSAATQTVQTVAAGGTFNTVTYARGAVHVTFPELKSGEETDLTFFVTVD